MKKLIHIYPLIACICLCLLYSWLNLSQRLFVGYFGCGCPRLDGRWHFNTNHLTMLVMGILWVFCAAWYFLLGKKVKKDQKITYCVSLGTVIGVVCLMTMLSNFWM